MTRTRYVVLLCAQLVAACVTSSEQQVALEVDALTSKEGFDWWVPDHFGARDSMGMLIMRTDSDYLKPSGFRVEFDACPSKVPTPPPSRYQWKFENQTAQGCRQSHVFAAEGDYVVTLTVSGENNPRVDRQTIHVKDWVVAVIGDSYASGEGNPDVAIAESVPQPIWADRRCHRSGEAASAQAALELERSDRRSSVTFVSVACSGAKITDWQGVGLDNGVLAVNYELAPSKVAPGGGVLTSYVGIEPTAGELVNGALPAQVQQLGQLLKGRRVDALLISIGGNDLEFSGVLTRCLLASDCSKIGLERWLQPHLQRLASNLDALARTLDVYIPHERVLITEYPDPSSNDDGELCEHIMRDFPDYGLDLSVTATELKFLREEFLFPLNAALANVATRHADWRFVSGISARFLKHGACATNSYLVSVNESIARQGPSDATQTKGVMHPNRAGQMAIRDALLQAFRSDFALSTFSVSTDELNFGPQTLGTTGFEHEITLTNTGFESIDILHIYPPFSHFTITSNTCLEILPGNGSCTLKVAFTPKSPQKQLLDSVQIQTSAKPSTYLVELKGSVWLPEISFEPARVVFSAETRFSRSAPASVTLRNSGTLSVAIASISAKALPGVSSVFSVLSHDCPLNGARLQVGDHCSVQLSLDTSSELGAANAELDVAAAAPNTGLHWKLPLAGSVGKPQLVVSTSGLTFPLQEVNTQSPPQTIRLQNNGTAPLTFANISMWRSDFSLVHNCPLAPQRLAPAAGCDVDVRFTPRRGGARSGNITVETDTEAGTQFLSLTGTAPYATLAPSTVDFGSVPVGSSSAPQTVTVTNESGQGLAITSSTLSGAGAAEFHVVADSCASSAVSPEDSCTLTLVYQPTAAGTSQAELRLTDSGPEGSRSVGVIGVATVSGSMSVSPNALTFNTAIGRTTSAQLTFTNHGTQRVVLDPPVVSDRAFQVLQSSCAGRAILPKASCSIEVEFTAAQRTVTTASLSVSMPGTGQVLSIALRGLGQSPELVAPVTALDLGRALVGSVGNWLNVSLLNTGNANLNVSAIRLPPEVEGRFDFCTGYITQPGRNCDFQIRLRPVNSGKYNLSLTVESDVPERSTTFLLTGSTY